MKVLFLTQLPPPIHGASVLNSLIKDSRRINSEINSTFINISTADGIIDIGQISFRKVGLTAKIIFQAIYAYLGSRPNLVYISLAPTGAALYKDGVIALLLKFLGATVVFHLHGKGIRKSKHRNNFSNFFYRLVFRNVAVIHLSERLVDDLDGVSQPHRIHIINNGISPPITIDSHKCFRNGRVKFLFLSNLVREKGPLDVLHACRILKDFSHKFTIVMAGRFYDAEFEREFRAYASELRLQNLKIIDTGSYGKDKRDLLLESHVMVLPTYYSNECFPLSLIEAMASHMAVISTDEGAIPDMIRHGDNGLLVKKRNPESLASAMRLFIENPMEAQRMGEAGYLRYQKKYTFEIFEQNLIDVLRKVAEEG